MLFILENPMYNVNMGSSDMEKFEICCKICFIWFLKFFCTSKIYEIEYVLQFGISNNVLDSF